MASQIIALANRWGTHFGGINTFNTGLMKALGQREDRDDFKLICIVESATEDDKAHAESSGVCLLESGANMLLNNAEALEAVARLVHVKSPTLWLGHDDKTGPLALDLRKKLGGKAVLFNHMAHVAYQGFKKGDSLKADEKKELQRKLFLQADHAICVGPRLHEELTDLLATSPNRPTVTMLMPGLDAPSDYEVEYRTTQPASFRGFAAGRLGPEDDRIKQGRLAIRGFVEAVEDQKTTGKLRMLARTPRICLMGVEKDQESELRPKLEQWAKRQLQVELIPFTADRQKYFHELASSSFAMMLSWHEGFGLVGWEAIAARVPLILGKNSGLWQFLEDKIGAAHVGQSIFPVDIRGHLSDDNNNENHRPEDVEAVKDAIEKLAASGEDAKKAAISLYNLIIKEGWTWQKAATDFIACVEPLLAPETPPGHTGDSAQVEPSRENSNDESAEQQDLAEKTNISSLRNPFKGDLTHWTTDDDKPLPGRDKVIKDIVAAMANPGDFILLRGRSGCGKSSLMQSGVMRKLREKDGSVLVPFRPTELMAGSGEGDALDKLACLIAEAASVPFTTGGPAAMRASNYAKRLRTSVEDNHITLVLGLDQFEEIIDVLKLERDRSTGTPLSGWWLVIHFLKALCHSPNIRLIATLESAREQSFLDLCIGEAIGLMPKTFNVDATDDTVGEIVQSGFSQGGLPLDSTVIKAIKIKWRAFEHDTSNSHASPLPLACLFFHRLYERFADLAGTTVDGYLENTFQKAGNANKDHSLTLEEIGGEDAITFTDIIQNLADAAWHEAWGNSDFADPIETDENFRGLNNFLSPLVMVDHDGQIQLRAVIEADADEPTRRLRKAFRKRRLLVPLPGLEQPRMRPVHQALFDRWSPANRWLAYRKETLQVVQRFREDAAYWHQRDKLVPLEDDGSTLRAAALTLREHALDWQLRRGGALPPDDAAIRDQALAVFDTAKNPLAVLGGSSRGYTFADLAASYHRVELLKRFFALKPESVYVEDREGRNLIHSAAWSNGPAIPFLIAQGVALKTEKSPWNAIMAPICEHLNDNFDAMINHVGLNDVIETSREHRMIHWAALYGNMYVIERLTQQDANLSVQNKYKQTALYYAAEHDQVDAFRYLLPHIDIQKSDAWERTAISIASLFGAARVIATYLAEEVNLKRLSSILRHRDNQGDTPLMIAARYRQAETLGVLLQPALDDLGDPSSPMHQSEDGDTLFHLIFRGSSNETPTEEDRFRARTLVEILLRDRRLHPNQPNNRGETPFDLGGDFPEARRVLRQDERVPNDYTKMTPAMRIEDLSSRRPDTVLRLINEAPQALTDSHEQASGGETGLEILIRLKNHKVLATLTENPSHWPTLKKEFQKLLTVAALPAAEGLRASLQRRFAKGEINPQEAGELLGICIDAADLQTAADLVKQGAPLSLRRDGQGSTVLHRAAITGDSERFRSVLAIGSFAVPLDYWGRRPSDLAAEQNVAKFRALEEGMKDPTNNTASSALSSSIVGLPPFLCVERAEESRTANKTEMALLQKEWQKEWGDIDALDISVFDLTFHPNVPLLELRPKSSYASGRICFLLGAKKLVLLKRNKLYRLNGTSPPIHEVNANQQLHINEKTVLDYLAFFCFFVRGDDGPFFIVDSQDNEFLPDLGQLQSEFEAVFRPPRVWGKDEQGNWRVSALVYYSDAVFAANFEVHQDGTVDMLDDTPLLGDLPARIDAPLEIRTLQ